MSNQNNNNNQNPNRRYIAKVKNQQGQYGQFQKILMENPNPVNQDGTPNKYHKGVLLWCDAETGKKYLVKQLAVRGVSQQASENGFSNSICIDLDNDYEVKLLD